MEKDIYNREKLLVGDSVLVALSEARVIVFGVGGVGSWCAEGLLRNGIKHLTLVDSDCVCMTNVNRQMQATVQTVGRAKVDALRDRLMEINPNADVVALKKMYCQQTAGEFDLDSYDYVIDAIDSLKDKILLILNASASKATLFSAMGAALKMDPSRIRVAEFWDVKGCPLGAMLRKRMRQNGTLPSKKVLCVYDDEVLENRGRTDDDLAQNADTSFKKAQINGSTVHITSIFGMTLAGLVAQDIFRRSL